MITQISASAGSGKTYTLTKRFLDLLNHAVVTPKNSGCSFYSDDEFPHQYGLSEVLAATFTNKAAAEMKTRVINSLKNYVLDAKNNTAAPEALQTCDNHSPENNQPERYERWLQNIFRHYSLLNIRTIDSLLNHLVRLSAIELGLPPDFELSFEKVEYFDPVYASLMEDLSALQRGYIAGDNDIFLSGSGEMLGEALENACNSLIKYGNQDGFIPRANLSEAVHTLFKRLLTGESVPVVPYDFLHKNIHSLHEKLTTATGALLVQLEKENLNVNKLFITALNKLRSVPVYEDIKATNFLSKDNLRECLNKSSQGAESSNAEHRFEEVKNAYTAYLDGVPLLKQAFFYAALAPLAQELFLRLIANMKQGHVLPALCQPTLARSVLSGEFGVSDALCRMGTRLSHLLLDEFQDTSIEQWAALKPLAIECLSTGGSITYVGDVKQAIYGWRGGEVSLFNNVLVESELLSIAPEPVIDNLPFNWRSSRAIVEHNNAFFSLLTNKPVARSVLEAMLPSATPQKYIEDGVNRLFQMYAKVKQAIPADKTDHIKGAVAFYKVQVSSGNNEILPALVSARLHTLLQDLCQKRPLSDIAILIRSKSEEQEVANWCAEWGLPVITENSFMLAEQPLIERLVSLLTFIDYPFNDLAFWEFVTGEECFGYLTGIPRSELDDWLARIREKETTRKPLYVYFQEHFHQEWSQYIAPFYNKSGLMSAYDILMEIIVHYNLQSLFPEQTPFLNRLLELVHLSEVKGKSSIASFLAFWNTIKEAEKLPLPEGMNAIRLMTIHKAKGLEFPVVILPFHHHGQGHSPVPEVVRYADTLLLTKAGPYLPDKYYPACVANELERINLLYVAWTRPVEELHAFLTVPSRPTSLSKALDILVEEYRKEFSHLCSFEELTMEDYGDVEEEDIIEDPTVVDSSAASMPGGLEDRDTQAITSPHSTVAGEALESPYEPMHWLPQLKIYRTIDEEADFTLRQRGILIHHCLEHLILREPSVDAKESVHNRDSAINLNNDIENAIQNGLYDFPLPIKDPEVIKADLRSALLWFATLPEASVWLAKGLREQTIIDECGNKYRVDMLYDDGQTIFCIDYKTGAHEYKTLPEPSHVSQVSNYMRLLSGVENRTVKGLLLYLDAQKACEIVA